MHAVFSTVLDMSLTASWVILAVLAFSKKYPVANAPSFESAPSPVASLGREQ